MEFTRIADKKRLHFITEAIKKNVPCNAHVLDIGCGNGIITKAIGKLGYEVTGVDVSEKTISQAISHNDLSNVHFRVTEAGELNAVPSKYHAIICSEVLEHLDDPASLLSIIHASLHDEGIVVVTVPNGKGPREIFVTRPVQFIEKKNNLATRLLSSLKNLLGYKGTTVQSSADDLSHVQFFTLKALTRLAASNGFHVQVIQSTNFIEQVFPFSLLFKRSFLLQKLDCAAADRLPLSLTSGFMSVWKKVK